MRYSDLTKSRPEPGCLLVNKLELECTKNSHEGDIVYFGQARLYRVAELKGWIGDFYRKKCSEEAEVVLPHGKGFAISKQSLISF
jgi:hypothetical protein